MSNTLIEFPKINPRTMSLEETLDDQHARKMMYAEEYLQGYSNQMLTKFAQEGFDIDDVFFIKCFAHQVAAARATIYAAFHLDHHFHDFIDKSYSALDNAIVSNYEEDDEPEE